MEGLLALEDGTILRGRGFGAVGGFGAEPAGGLVAAGAADAVGVLSSMV